MEIGFRILAWGDAAEQQHCSRGQMASSRVLMTVIASDEVCET